MKHSAIDLLESDPGLYAFLLERVGKAHLRQRIGVETEHAADRFGQGRTFFHIENWRLARQVIRGALKASGLWGRGQRNVFDFKLRHRCWKFPHLPESFEGYTILQLSDLHLDAVEGFAERLAECVSGLEYDLCVLTGDYRFLTFGPCDKAMEGLDVLCRAIDTDIYAILGNHDTLLMAQAIESMGVHLLLNENTTISSGAGSVCIAGIDDPHYFAVDNLEKAHQGIPDDAVSILLAHSPEIYRNAAYAGFDLMLCGHTHGGQICMPGGFALTYNSSAPRYTGVGPWSFDLMQGYTSAGTGSSVVAARFNCPPEITLHTLSVQREPAARSQ
jgi:predicted MPP superfamily phosphohydrolase